MADDLNSFGSNFVNVGSLHNSKAGKYLLRLGDSYKWGIAKGSKDYQQIIDTPTSAGVLLIRVEAKNNNTDVPIAAKILQESNLTTVARSADRCSGSQLPPLTMQTFAGLQNLSEPEQIMELTARLQPGNPPFNVSDVMTIEAKLAAAGIRRGKYEKPQGVNLTQAFAAVQEKVQAAAVAGAAELGNGWIHDVPQGMYGDNFGARALIAKDAYFESQPSQAIYPSYLFGSSQFTALQKGEALLYEFVSGKPPLTPNDSFWSLTVYNNETLLLSNPYNIYAIGDRSNITYPDGALVYGSNLDGDDTKPFQILVQSKDNVPPKNWTYK